MSKFAFIPLESTRIGSRPSVYALEIGGTCQFADFLGIKLSEPQYRDEMISILRVIEQFSNMKMIPKTRFRDITPKGNSIKEYEFKKQAIRIYAAKISNLGALIIFASSDKDSQARDIKNFQRTKSQLIAEIGNKNPHTFITNTNIKI